MEDANKTPLSRELRGLKAALTKAKKSKNPQRIIDTVNRAMDRFEIIGYPDDWTTWTRAADDARFELSRSRW